jgi:hypothetical protein
MLTAPKYFLAENLPAGKGRGGKAFSKNEGGKEKMLRILI